MAARSTRSADPTIVEAVQLETGTTLILLACGSGAYNLSSLPLIARSRGGQVAFEIAPFDYQMGHRGRGTGRP